MKGWLDSGFDSIQLWMVNNRGRVKLWAFLCGVAGLIVTPLVSYDIATIPWDVDKSAPRVLSEPPDCGYFGAKYDIVVQGFRYTCEGAETKCGNERLEVAYDPSAPSRCRVAMNAGEPSLSQLMFGSGGLALIAFAANLVLWLPKAPQRMRRHTLGALALFALIAISFGFSTAHLVVHGAP